MKGMSSRRRCHTMVRPSNGTGTFTGIAHVGPGYVNTFGRVDCTWDGGSSGSFSGRVDASALAEDLFISQRVSKQLQENQARRARSGLTAAGGGDERGAGVA